MNDIAGNLGQKKGNKKKRPNEASKVEIRIRLKWNATTIEC